MYGPYKLFFDASLLYDISKLVASNPIMKIKLCKFVSLFLHFDTFHVYVYLIKKDEHDVCSSKDVYLR